METIKKEQALLLLFLLKSDEEIMAFLKNYSSGSSAAEKDSEVWGAGVLLLHSEKLILEALNKAIDRDWPNLLISEPAIKALKLEEKTEKELFRLMELVPGRYFCKKCLPFFKISEKDEAELIRLMKIRKDVDKDEIYKECLEYLFRRPLKQKRILSLMAEFEYDERFCAKGIQYLHSEKNIVSVMKKSNYYKVCAAGIKNLKTEATIFKIIKKTKFPFLMGETLDSLFKKKNDKEILSILVSNDSTIFYIVGARYLKACKNLLFVLEKTNYCQLVCLEVVKKIKAEEIIIKIMKLYKRDYKICEEASLRLKIDEKSEAEMIEIMKKTDYDFSVCGLVSARLKLEEKTAEEILDLIKESDFSRYALCVYLPILEKKLNNKTKK